MSTTALAFMEECHQIEERMEDLLPGLERQSTNAALARSVRDLTRLVYRQQRQINQLIQAHGT